MNRRNFFATLTGAFLAGPKAIAEALKPKPHIVLGLNRERWASALADMIDRIDASASWENQYVYDPDYEEQLDKLYREAADAENLQSADGTDLAADQICPDSATPVSHR